MGRIGEIRSGGRCEEEDSVWEVVALTGLLRSILQALSGVNDETSQ